MLVVLNQKGWVELLPSLGCLSRGTSLLDLALDCLPELLLVQIASIKKRGSSNPVD